ncbi:BURP domain protein RD22 [Ricinus communis]|uniref:Polygalacturonase, putative n=1 Tax=Ricinus communis TaxID=3988 RepID=B9SAG0_RICCO|nr:BURP domain protein RD22 [Ricinus communis]EEF39409.1 polygalacturonase, putative [Ricinus communis]|eukprot:XP_002522979.1 BURP domain protein RD22 [Ricinus communis]
MYWQSMLPSTPMPEAIYQLIQPGNKSTFSEVEVGVALKESSALPRIDYDIGYTDKGAEKVTMANSTTIFFLYDDLLPGKRMMLVFTKSTSRSSFLPRKIAETIPFSSNKFSEILNYLSIKPTSKQSQIMKQTIEDCETPGVKGEDKYCATSLESLVDFVIAKLGKEVHALSNKGEEEDSKQNYTILKEIKMMGGNQIVCHKMRYVYAVFYCHIIMPTMVYLVPLVGDNGCKAKAVVICHTNTSSWNPEHFAFRVLKVKPGGPPICHFLNSDTIVWVSNSI